MKSRIIRSLRKLVGKTTVALAKRYVQKDRWYRYDDLRLKVLKNVFHSGLFRSSKVFAEWIAQQPIINKKILEIGSGSGLISLVAAKKGAIVTAVDINPKAVENTRMNAALNHLNITVIQSDLFNSISDDQFDAVFINPPYYPKLPKNDYEKAWFCGEDFDYFRRLFKQLAQQNYRENCYMILSDTCDLLSIHRIADQFNIRLNEVYSKKISEEKLIIYKTSAITPA